MKRKSNIGWIIGNIFLSAVCIMFVLIIIGALNQDQQSVHYTHKNDVIAQLSSGAEMLIPAYENIQASDIYMEPVEIPCEYTNASVTAYAFEVEGMTEFNSLLRLKIPYDASQIDANEDPSKCVIAGFYDTGTDTLQPAIYQVDTTNECVIITTDHLTPFFAVTFKNQNERNEQAKGAFINSRMDDIVPSSAMTVYDNIVKKMIDDADLSVVNAVNLSATALSNTNSLVGGGASLMQDGLISSEWLSQYTQKKGEYLDDCFEELSNYGNLLIVTQVMLDLANGQPEVMNDNLMKNLAGYAQGKVNGMVGIATFAIDYSLNQLGTVIEEDKQVLVDGYKKYYEEYERNQEKSFSVRMYQDVYQIYKDNGIMGHYVITDIEKQIEELLMNYCEIIWQEEYVEYFGNVQYRNLLDDKMMNQLSQNAYDELIKGEMKAVFSRVQKQLIYDATMETILKQQALEMEYSTEYNLYIQEAHNSASEEYVYANCILQFDAYEEIKPSWTFQVDETGQFKSQFTKSDYFYAQAPRSAKVYKTMDDLSKGKYFEEITFELNEHSKEMKILLGSDYQFTLEATSQQVQRGQTIGLNVEPMLEGYTYQWNISDKYEHYVEFTPLNLGKTPVSVTILDDKNLKVAELSIDITVVEEGIYALKPDKSAIEVGETTNIALMLNDELTPTSNSVYWDFGDGTGDYYAANIMACDYTKPGQYTVTARIIDKDTDGNEIILGEASTLITVTEKAPVAVEDEFPNVVGTYVYQRSDTDGNYISSYTFNEDGTVEWRVIRQYPEYPDSNTDDTETSTYHLTKAPEGASTELGSYEYTISAFGQTFYIQNKDIQNGTIMVLGQDYLRE